MGKGRNRIRILLCCFLIPCLLLSGCLVTDSEEPREYSYDVYNINGSPDIYYNKENTDYNFSATERSTFISSKFKEIAVSDEYLIGLVTSESVRAGHDELWRYDRTTDSYDLILETEHNSIHVVKIYQNYIIYGGRWGINFYICPIDGSPETDSISLPGLLAEEDIQEWEALHSGSYQVREAGYQGLRVVLVRERYHEEYRVMGILDEDSGEVIWSVGYLPHSGDVVFWSENEWVLIMGFGNGFRYQKEGEEEHIIQCLDDPKYWDSNIYPYHFTREGDRVVGLMSVLRDYVPWVWRGWEAGIENDILFEINLETGDSRIICETDSAQTRIIGYKNGRVYFLEDDVIYAGWIGKEEREKIYDFQEEGWQLYHSSSGKHVDMTFRWQGDDLTITGFERRSIHILE